MPYREFLRTTVYAGSLALVPFVAAAQTTSVSLLPDGTPPVSVEPSPTPAATTDVTTPMAPSREPAAVSGPPPASTPPVAPAAAAATEPKPAVDPEQVKITAPRSSGIAAIVNDTVISDYDLDQRTALFVATSGVRPSKETLAQIRTQVLRSLEDEILELQEATKHKINVTKADVDKALKNIAEDNHLTTEQIMSTITQAGVSPDVFRQQLAAQLTWQRLVAARYGTDVLISDQEIDEAMDRLRQGADKPQFLVSEIFLAVDQPQADSAIHTSADQIVQQLKQGAPFTAVASQFSNSPSAADGGDIGWVVQGQLPEELDQAIENLEPGDIAGPIHAEGGYYVLELRDRREPAGTKVEDKSEKPADPNAPIPLARLLLPIPPVADQKYRDQAMQLGNNLKAQLRSCQDLTNAAKQLPGSVFADLGTTNPKELAPELRDGLAKTHAGEMVQPYFDQAGLELVMRCDKAPPKIEVFKLPTRDQLQQQLFVQQMSILGKSYLRDLRRDAVVETR